MPPRKPLNKNNVRRTALALFGDKGGSIMETAEERELVCNLLIMSDKPALRILAEEARMEVNAKKSFAKLAERHGQSIHTLSKEIGAIQDSIGFLRQSMHVPEAMEQSALRAKAHEIECKTCDGAGSVGEKPCKKCHGAGKVKMEGSIEHLRMLFESRGIIGKGGGVNVGINLGNIKPHETMAELSASVAPLLEGVVKE